MSTPTSFGTACVAAACLALIPKAKASDNASVLCGVAIEYRHNNAIVEQYLRDFVVQEGVVFVDDLSTPLRSRTFRAEVVKDGGDVRVSIDYFSDVGVFVAVGFDAQLTLRGGGAPESTEGSQTTSISAGVSPAVVGGNHRTAYRLTCRRN